MSRVDTGGVGTEFDAPDQVNGLLLDFLPR
jgi:hypothetical protein